MKQNLFTLALVAFTVGLPWCHGETPLNASIEEGYTYTREEIQGAQEAFRQGCPPEVEQVFYHPTEWIGNILSEERYYKKHGPEFFNAFLPYARRMTHPLPGVTDQHWEYLLFVAGDLETIRKYVSTSRMEIAISGNPDVVALLAPRVFETFIYPPSTSFPVSHWVVLRLESVMANCEDFPAEVGIWTRRLTAIAPPIETRVAIYKKWWLDNRQALEARRWDQVRAGPLSIPGMPYSDGPNAPIFDTPQPEASPPTPSTPPLAAAPPASPTPAPRAVATDTPTYSIAFLWSGAALAITLLLGLVWFFQRRV